MKGSGLMEVVLPLSRLGEMTAYMDERVSRHLHEGQSEAFEGFEEFDLIAFDWYDVHSDWTEDSRCLLYLRTAICIPPLTISIIVTDIIIVFTIINVKKISNHFHKSAWL